MKPLMFIALAAAALAAEAAPNGLALAGKYNCLACHAADHKIVGPAYKDVAAKYKGDKGAVAKLMAKVKAGGSGVWGPVPMPAQQVSDADLKVIIDWVLSQK